MRYPALPLIVGQSREKMVVSRKGPSRPNEGTLDSARLNLEPVH
jgi:hypothetical protein